MTTLTQGKLTATIRQDELAPDPRKDYDHLGTMACWHGRYDLGDVQPSGEPTEYLLQLIADVDEARAEQIENDFDARWNALAEDPAPIGSGEHRRMARLIQDDYRQTLIAEVGKAYVMLPLYLIDHSGLAMNTTGFRGVDPGGWDSGQVGYILCSLQRARPEWPDVDDAGLRERLEACLLAEVEEYNQYLGGDVWDVLIEDEDGEVLDSCGGFFGAEYAEEEARTMLDAAHQAYMQRSVVDPLGMAPLLPRGAGV